MRGHDCPICLTWLEPGYVATLCPQCIATAVLTDAVEAATSHLRWLDQHGMGNEMGRLYASHVMATAATSADLVLTEDPQTLARFAAT